MSFAWLKMLSLGVIVSSMPNAALPQVTGDALTDARNRQVCGTGELVRAKYLESGVLQVYCRGGPVTNNVLEGTALAGGAGAAGLAALVILAVVIGDSSDGTTTTTTTTR
ncbi:hypothetical protein FEE96_19475 [Parasedimentitalea maritima]|uniref:Uncharacterized protein n=1 Tax=Parasedimentitalea maritima TaxID=2578117 RepID=A0A5R8YW23_9RHOB|nr:hypothetical protein [Zongyanglinia marina]KAE9627595.1 hypothetical protein GP644_18610 [Zongyanglinia marina]TLP57561.1 hypothetical protein FEE96_19475 [Zongyanglinia marina]